MKLHDLQPAPGSHAARTRVGRGIAAGKGKTAGRGTKGQKARAGGSIPPWFEGGQTPLHMRIPKLRGFKNRGKVEYEIVNVGDIAVRIDAGAFAESTGGGKTRKSEPLTINAETLRAVGLVRDIRKPLKVLGGGELSAALFVVADAFTKSAVEKIEGAGGSVSVLEVPARSMPAIGVDGAGEATAGRSVEAAAPSATESASPRPAKSRKARPESAPAEPAAGSARSETAAADDTAAPDDTAAVAVDDEPAATAADAPEGEEPAEAPDAVAEAAGEASLPGDDSERDPVPGDDA
jgi:large subunit ribosomal protein L15